MKTPTEIGEQISDDHFDQSKARIGLPKRIAAAIQERDDEHAAQVKELRDALEGLRNELPDECSCHESYTSREKNLGYRFKDPNCLYCEFDDEIKAADAVLARTDSAPSEQTAEKSAKP